jgi:hypothetical protein
MEIECVDSSPEEQELALQFRSFSDLLARTAALLGPW